MVFPPRRPNRPPPRLHHRHMLLRRLRRQHIQHRHPHQRHRRSQPRIRKLLRRNLQHRLVRPLQRPTPPHRQPQPRKMHSHRVPRLRPIHPRMLQRIRVHRHPMRPPPRLVLILPRQQSPIRLPASRRRQHIRMRRPFHLLRLDPASASLHRPSSKC